MKTSTRIALCMTLSACCIGVVQADEPQCKEIHAEMVDTKDPLNCVSPYGFCATGTIHGNHGLNGTTYFVLDGVGRRPDSAPGTAVTSGLLTYTTDDGTLTVRETGVNKLVGSPSNGILASIQEFVSGTGRFEGATLSLFSIATDVNGVFYSTITGELCLAPPAP
jgi:hypothetical protein